jgi:hypothetical protein
MALLLPAALAKRPLEVRDAALLGALLAALTLLVRTRWLVP